MAERAICEVTIVLPLAFAPERTPELESFVEWCGRPLQGSQDVRVQALVACAAALWLEFRASRSGVGHA